MQFTGFVSQLFQKVLMSKWRRVVQGYAYDPTPEMDIHWSEEYSSDDRDSEDLHSEPRSDDSPDDPTTDDDYVEPEPPLSFVEVEQEAEADESTPANPAMGNPGDVPIGEGAPAASEDSAPLEQLEAATPSYASSDSDTIDWCK